MKECNAIYQRGSKKRVVCIKVNVKNTSSSYEQLLLHQSVDALIGVHGAQLTQAILLPPHRHVLELLPWVTDNIRGWWVQTRHTPTPLGIIFHNSDLNHVGIPWAEIVFCCATASAKSEAKRRKNAS
ncbi:hypothetical protein ACHAW6_001285 [Cyclotella cf. meneghiniana]